MEKLIDIHEGGIHKYNGSTIKAVYAGMQPNRCKHCYFNRKKIEHCYNMACRADEREDGCNVYFVIYDTERAKKW